MEIGKKDNKINNKFMIKEITQSIIAVLIVGGALYAAIAGLEGITYLVGIAGIVVGFYFKEGTTLLGRALSNKK